MPEQGQEIITVVSIFSRYFSRQVLSHLSILTLLLLVTFTSTRFSQYLQEAAAGKIEAGVVFTIMAYRLPGFLALILPAALFLSLLLVLGRMYVEHEMSVLQATGMSNLRLIRYLSLPTLIVMLTVALFSLYLNPLGRQQTQEILHQQAQRTAFDFITPGTFYSAENGKRVLYAEERHDDRLANVFIAESAPDQSPSVMVAREGHLSYRPENQQRYMVLTDGHRYNGNAGETTFRVLDFAGYGIRLDSGETRRREQLDEAIPTSQLMTDHSPRGVANLQWRLSLPLLVPVIALLAIPLSRVNPRQGRFARILPAMLIYVAYLGSLIYARKAIDGGTLTPFPGLWMVHLLFLCVAAGLLWANPGAGLRRIRYRRRNTPTESY